MIGSPPSDVRSCSVFPENRAVAAPARPAAISNAAIAAMTFAAVSAIFIMPLAPSSAPSATPSPISFAADSTSLATSSISRSIF